MRGIKARLVLSTILLACALITMYSHSVIAQEEGEVLTSNATTDPVTTFTISFAIGAAGALVYIFLLLMTDRTISILRNDILPLMVMIILFMITGGIVAGITQTASGTGIAANNVQTVFMVGFGWQGAISGAGGSSKVAEEKENTIELKSLLDDLI